MTLSRRALIGSAGAGAVALGAGAGYASATIVDQAPSDRVEFVGTHQAGITTAAQDRLHFVVLDVTTDRRDELISLLKDWTDAARQLTAGQPIGRFGAVAGPSLAPPEDTGEALGLDAARLTLTIGFGPSLFGASGSDGGADRFGLGSQRPEPLVDLPAFVGDRLDPALTGGDIAIQACADDPQVAVHAIRNMVRIAVGRAAVRYSQLGFGRTSSTSRSQTTPRNLFGFKDGTANIAAEDRAALNDHVWVRRGDGPDWLVGGSYLVTRKIAMRIETWDRESLHGQEQIIGRTKGAGAPLSGGEEFSEIDLSARGAGGEVLMPTTSHVARAHPDNNGGARILRRGYNYVDGSDGLGQLSAGLFFLSYQRDPGQFIRIQQDLAGMANDALNEYIVHVGSGLFACPPGVANSGFWGESLVMA